MGEALIGGAKSALWVAHRRDLVSQTARRLESSFGSRVGVVMPGERENRDATIFVGTVQTLMSRVKAPADYLVLDEAHHYVATEWAQLRDAYPKARVVGLTATPQRSDGEAMGDVFSEIVVAASYSELLREGFLVPARVHRPRVSLGNDLAQDPIEAWRRYSEGSRTFVFCARTSIARDVAQRFRDAGVLAGTIEANTPKREREELLESFRRGKHRVITNVGTMTEGIDVPEARTAILMRAFDFVGQYLQVVGRVLRPAKDKRDAVLIDLTGASIKHGLPTDDRRYSLEGKAISGQAFGGGGVAPEFAQEVRGVDLVTVASGALAEDMPPAEAVLAVVDSAKRRAEYDRLLGAAKLARMRPGFARARYYDQFGEWPPGSWG